jgi:hypothetical protein
MSLHTAARRQVRICGAGGKIWRDASSRATKAFYPALSPCGFIFSGVCEQHPRLRLAIVELELPGRRTCSPPWTAPTPSATAKRFTVWTLLHASRATPANCAASPSRRRGRPFRVGVIVETFDAAHPAARHRVLNRRRPSIYIWLSMKLAKARALALACRPVGKIAHA